MKRGAVNKKKKFLHEHRCGIEIDDPNQGQHRYIVTFSLTPEELLTLDAVLDEGGLSVEDRPEVQKLSRHLRQAAARKEIQLP